MHKQPSGSSKYAGGRGIRDNQRIHTLLEFMKKSAPRTDGSRKEKQNQFIQEVMKMVKVLLIGLTGIAYLLFFSLVRAAGLADQRLEEIKRLEEIRHQMGITEVMHEQRQAQG